MKQAAWVVVVYSFILLLGGIAGYHVAHSLASLVAATSFALVLLFCAYHLFHKRKGYAFVIVLLLLLLDGFFTVRYLKSYLFLPAGLMSLITLATLGALIVLIQKSNPKLKL